MPLLTGSRRSKATASRSRRRALTTTKAWPQVRLGLLLLLALQLGLAACSGDNLLLPSAGQPAKISVVSGDGQTATVGHPLGDSLVVVVTDPEGRAVQGVEVAFVAPAGAAMAPGDTVATGANGQAAVIYTLGTTAGSQTVEARATPVVSSPSLTTTFTASAVPETAAVLESAGGDGQTGQVSAALADSLAVRAVDRFGNGVSGVEVSWEAAGGSVSAASVVTGADGRSTVERVLGNSPGSYLTTATVAGLDGSPVAFTSVASAPSLALVTQPSPAASAGVQFGQQPVLQLQDAAGAPLARADVTVTVQIATGTGSLGGTTTAKSDAQGRVGFSDLSIRGAPGARTLIFAASDFTSAVSTPIAVSPGPPNTEQSTASVRNGTAGVATTISVRLKDEFGTPVTGETGAITVSVAGANPVAAATVSEDGGGSYTASYTPMRTGTDQVAVQVSGKAVSGSPFTSIVGPGPASAVTTTAVVTKTGFIFTQVSVLVTTRDGQGNLMGQGGERVEVQLNSGDLREATDKGDGTYSDSFLTFAPDIVVSITLNGVPISGSPFRP